MRECTKGRQELRTYAARAVQQLLSAGSDPLPQASATVFAGRSISRRHSWPVRRHASTYVASCASGELRARKLLHRTAASSFGQLVRDISRRELKVMRITMFIALPLTPRSAWYGSRGSRCLETLVPMLKKRGGAPHQGYPELSYRCWRKLRPGPRAP